jgi:tetratricopeptide (TPR) repeat protein
MVSKFTKNYFGLSESLVVRLWVVFYIALVAYPCLMAYWPVEQAKMYVAAAENALDKAKQPEDERFQEARKLLAKARESDPTIVNTFDYLRVLDQVDPLPLAQLLPALKYLSPNSRRSVGYPLAEDAMKRKEFEKSYQILSMISSFEADKTPEERNRLAYGAALAKKDLRLALKEVDLALSDLDREVPGILDTKAWVLHELHKDEEALVWIDRAISLFQSDLLEIYSPRFEITKEQLEEFLRSPDSSEDSKCSFTISDVKNEQLVKIFQELAVYQYHRAEILSSLKQSEKADWAFDWLENRGFNKFSELF